MKKRTIWIIAAVILVLLITRAFTNHIDGVNKERQWYIRELEFEFSAVIDTASPGKVIFHLTSGNLDRHKEARLADKLHYNGMLDLFLYRPENRIELMADHTRQFHPGDSVYLNTTENVVRIYRKGKLQYESDLLKYVRGRPF